MRTEPLLLSNKIFVFTVLFWPTTTPSSINKSFAFNTQLSFSNHLPSLKNKSTKKKSRLHFFQNRESNPNDTSGDGSFPIGNDEKYSDASSEMSNLEKKVMASTQEKIDVNRVTNALLQTNDNGFKTGSNDKVNDDDDLDMVITSQWNIALAAGCTSSLLSYALFHNTIASTILFLVVTVLASADPMEEEGIGGAIARIIGRNSLRSMKMAQPKVRSLLRAAVEGDDELELLRTEVQRLQDENEELKRLLAKKQMIGEMLSDYTLEGLKGICRQRGVVGISGMTKERLLTKLVDEGVIDLPGHP